MLCQEYKPSMKITAYKIFPVITRQSIESINVLCFENINIIVKYLINYYHPIEPKAFFSPVNFSNREIKIKFPLFLKSTENFPFTAV